MHRNTFPHLPGAPRWRTLAVSIGLVHVHLGAQTAPAPSPQPGAAVELSPFVVASDKDTGYAATETLAGTRMRTSLRDVGASLTILTPEFLRDLGVNSFDQALLYTPSVDNVEGDNSDGNRASGSTLRYGTGQSYSIRGFVTNAGNQSISHDFFNALEPTDNYNLERITLSLGPNALLIGVGNPQGTAVTTTKRAELQRRKTEVQLQSDTNGSRRGTLDHNQPLFRDRLAVRINLLHDQTREFRRNEGKNQNRMTLGLTAKPYANTKIMLNHENYSLGTNAASLLWGFDSAALRWAAAGKPTVEFLSAGSAWAAANRSFVDARGNRVPVAAGVVDADGFVDAESDFDPRDAIVQGNGQSQTYVAGLNLANPLVNFRYQANLQPAVFGSQAGSAYQSSKSPWTLLGLKKTTNLNGGTWDDPANQQHGRWSQILVEQKLATGLYLELAANVADYKQDLDPDFYTTITIDPNRYLPDGTINPGYLAPYTDNGQMQWRHVHNKSAEYRTTLSYELDLTGKNRWLGAHNFSGLHQTARNTFDQDLQRVFNLASVGLAGWSGDSVNGVNYIRSRAYFVKGNEPVMPDVNQVIKNLSALNGLGRLSGATAAERAPINLSSQSFLPPQKSKFTDDSLSLGWQARWLKGRLITVAGYRRDDTKSYAATTAGNREVALAAIPGSATDPLKKYYTPSEVLALDPNPVSAASGISRTYGTVLHALSWLSLSYNRSSNFLPVANSSSLNALAQPPPNSAGKTQEYGARFYLLQAKLSVALTKFETVANDQSRNANGSVGGTRNILTRLRTNYKNAGDSHFAGLAESGFYPVDTGAVNDTWSYVAKGYEMNMVYNPSRNWRTALSGSINTNATGAHLLALGRYLYTDSQYQGLGTWRKFAGELNKVAAGQRSAFFDLDPASPVARAQAAADAIYLTQQADTQELVWKNEQAITGITTNRSGQYAVNGIVTRAFHEGRLKGWSVGGNFRWRSANIVGYENILSATGAPTGLYDVNKALRGKQYWDVGAMLSYQRRFSNKMDFRAQLNIQNLPNWQDPRLVKSAYDTFGYKAPVNTIVPVLWELRRPRNFVLTTTFTF